MKSIPIPIEALTQHFASERETRPSLLALSIERQGIVSTNGHVLMVVEHRGLAADAWQGEARAGLIPAAVAARVARYARSDIHGAELPVELRPGSAGAELYFGGSTIALELQAMIYDFPRWESALPTTDPTLVLGLDATYLAQVATKLRRAVGAPKHARLRVELQADSQAPIRLSINHHGRRAWALLMPCLVPDR